MGEQVSESWIAVGLKKHGRVFLPFSGILGVLCVPPLRTLRLIASHLAKQLQNFLPVGNGLARIIHERSAAEPNFMNNPA